MYYSRGVVLVPLQQDVDVCLEGLEAEQHPLHAEEARLQEPDQLVDVVARDLLGRLQQEHRGRVPRQQRADGAAVLARTSHHALLLCQLLTDNLYFFYIYSLVHLSFSS